jgi:hypothetical protein
VEAFAPTPTHQPPPPYLSSLSEHSVWSTLWPDLVYLLVAGCKTRYVPLVFFLFVSHPHGTIIMHMAFMQTRTCRLGLTDWHIASRQLTLKSAVWNLFNLELVYGKGWRSSNKKTKKADISSFSPSGKNTLWIFYGF